MVSLDLRTARGKSSLSGSNGSRSPAGAVLHWCAARRASRSAASLCLNGQLRLPEHNGAVQVGNDPGTRAPLFCSCLVAACASGMLLCCEPLQAAVVPSQLHPQMVLLDTSSGNAAIMQQLKQLQQTKQKFGTQDPGSALAARFTGAQQQLQRIELLVKIQQYDNARMQLREGSFKSLRSDLRYESEYRGVQPELARDIIEGVEKLDRQLRGQEQSATIAEGLKKLQQQLQQLVDAAQPLT